jgi:dihydrofolate synthase/folylpolyglutamate synthase
VDGAHNPDSARSLTATLREALEYRRVVALVGGGADKDLRRIVTVLAGLGPDTRFLFTRPATHPRAADPRTLAKSVPNAAFCRGLPAALSRARREAAKSDLILVTGSLYLAGEALTLLDGTLRGAAGSGPGCPPRAGSRARR